jgi:CRP-like cAMP-binding protein
MTWDKADLDFETIQQRQLLARLTKSVGLFEGFSAEELKALLGNAERRVFEEGEFIIREGEEGAFMYLILAGKVAITKRLESGDGKPLAVFEPGDCFGEMSLLDSETRSASAQAVSRCLLLRINDANLEGKDAIGAKLYRNVARQLSRRLRHTNAMISLLLADENGAGRD